MIYANLLTNLLSISKMLSKWQVADEKHDNLYRPFGFAFLISARHFGKARGRDRSGSLLWSRPDSYRGSGEQKL